MTTITDSFDRANAVGGPTALGNADTGQTWTQPGATTLGINSNQAYSTATSGEGLGIITGFAYNIDASMVLVSGAAQNVGIVFRYRDANNFCLWQGTTAGSFYYHRRAGTYSQRSGTGPVPPAGSTLRVVAQDDYVHCYINDTLVHAIVETGHFTPTTDTGIGFRLNNGRAESFTATDVVALAEFDGALVDVALADGSLISGPSWVYKGRDAKSLDTIGAS